VEEKGETCRRGRKRLWKIIEEITIRTAKRSGHRIDDFVKKHGYKIAKNVKICNNKLAIFVKGGSDHVF
jgi:hypothetical protein